MQKNTDQKNSEHGHFLRSDKVDDLQIQEIVNPFPIFQGNSSFLLVNTDLFVSNFLQTL